MQWRPFRSRLRHHDIGRNLAVLRVNVIDDAEPVPAFYHVEISESPNGAYRPSEIVVRNPDMLASAIQGLRQKLAMAANAVELVERQVAELAPRKAKKVRRVRETIQSASRMAAAM